MGGGGGLAVIFRFLEEQAQPRFLVASNVKIKNFAGQGVAGPPLSMAAPPLSMAACAYISKGLMR